MTAYRAIGGTRVGCLPSGVRDNGHGKIVTPCDRCGIMRERRKGQAWCVDCKEAERKMTPKLARKLRAAEARDEEAMTNAIRTIGSERVRRGLAGAA